MPAPPPAPIVYVVHAPGEKEWVDGYLVPALGLSPGQWTTSAAAGQGLPAAEEIERGVAASAYTILVAGRAAATDPWAHYAEQLAAHLRIVTGRDRLIVIKRDDSALPLRLDVLVGLDCSDPARWDSELARLRAHLGRGPASAEEDRPCPYPGLVAFEPSQRGRFFGRVSERDQLVKLLVGDEVRRLFVIGPSGVGKTSLVRAGVVPILQERGFHVQPAPVDDAGRGPRGELRVLVPGAKPAAALRQHLGWREGEAPAAAVARILSGTGGRRLLVLIDPLEQIFTQPAAGRDGDGERMAFYRALDELEKVPACTVLCCVRADFYSELMASPMWGTGPRVDVAPLGGDGLRAAIREPAWTAEVLVDPLLVERLVGEVEADPGGGALPFLQEALRELWTRRALRFVPIESYQAMGRGALTGLQVAIDRGAEQTYGVLDAAEKQVARQILLGLLAFPEGRGPVRRRQSVDALRRAGDAGSRARFDTVLDRLAAARLVVLSATEITTPAGPAQTRHAELAHEAMIRGWTTLGTWSREHRAAELLRRELEAHATRWEKGESGLLDVVELSQATAYLASDAGKDLGASPLLLSLVARSRRARFLRRAAYATVTTALAGLLGIAVVFNSRLRAEEKKTQVSIGQASTVAEAIVYGVDAELASLPGGAALRGRLLPEAIALSDTLHRLGGGDRIDTTKAAGLIEQGRLAASRGQLDEAGARYGEALASLRAIVDRDPRLLLARYEVAATQSELSEIAEARGDLSAARQWAEAARDESEALALADPQHLFWQRPRAGSYQRLAHVLERLDELAGAERWYQAALQVIAPLLESEPEDTDLQAMLGSLAAHLSDLAIRRGQLSSARDWSNNALRVREHLRDQDPTNATWQKDLFATRMILGDLAVQAGDLTAAQGWFEQAATDLRKLVAADGGNTDWRYDLASAQSRLGDLALRGAHFDEAQRQMEAAHDSVQKLVVIDERNAIWRRNLATGMAQLGNLALARKDLPGARRWYEQSLAERRKLAALDPADVRAVRDVAVTLFELGRVAEQQHDEREARTRYADYLATLAPLAEQHPDDVELQRDLLLAYFHNLRLAAGTADRQRYVDAARPIFARLAATHALDGDAQFETLRQFFEAP